MRIGVLSLPLITNYGGILQSWAMQTVLSRLGHDVRIINTPRRNLRLPIYKMPFVYLKRILYKYLLHRREIVFREYLLNKTYSIVSQNTRRFIKEHINLRQCNTLLELQENEFDAIIVGSDQIWRPVYYKPIKNAFLCFAEQWDIKRIAYAPSFGTDSWEYSDTEAKRCAGLLSKFDAVSVREHSGVKLCQHYLGGGKSKNCFRSDTSFKR